MNERPDLEQLLTVQDLDTVADRLRHRRATLAERAELARCHDQLATLDARSADLRARRAELAREQARREDDIAALVERAARADATLYSGTVSAMRELLALQEEIASLGRRRGSLEDEIIELMEQAEPVDDELSGFDDQRAAIDAVAAALTASIVEAEVAIDGELATAAEQRAEAIAAVPADLVSEYERLRARLGGTGIARVVGASCGGCHLMLSAVERDSIRRGRSAERIYCSECGRLLVA